ncbi:microtubule-associated protein TORTIFOLIA1-like [Cornus florida]|uniref:microtubule-associated protein TORTIFOLIA1-like n=1 Tax=Cornus florida TaxID=4283 RepID=UPI00289D3235|nr:microtubule-associated protein TORTIFOLIA1-like [Cornus florida]XP_059662508.1 microtubule-associated protein TORTIFOLIA1-like [Cornus florida]
MSSLGPKSSRSSKSPSQPSTTTPSRSSSSSSSSLSSHLAMIELKQRVLTSLSKLSDRDTHQIAVEDLEKIIQTLSSDGVSMLLNCLYDATNDPKAPVKKESLRLLAALCTVHGDSTATHLTKIIAHIVRRLKDSDSGVRDACRDAIGSLSSQYLKGEGDNGGLGSVVLLFVKPLFEALSEQNKGVQVGSAMCMAKMVECASDPPISAFQKLCPRICKYLNNPNFLAKSSLLPVVSILSQVGAIAPQSLDSLLQSIQDCLGSSDWATRKAAADTLGALALHSSSLITDSAASTLTVLEACRFDKIKPVRDSMTEALQLWKKIAGKGKDGASDDQKASSHDGQSSEPAALSRKDLKAPNPSETRTDTSAKDSLDGSSPTDSASKTKGGNISDKTVGMLKKKAPALSDKELNPEFFLKLETRGSDDLPVEVVVPRRCLNSSNSNNEGEPEPNDVDPKERSKVNCQPDDGPVNIKYRNVERETAGVFSRRRDVDDFTRDKWSEERINGKGNWLVIQRQLLQLERQQAHLMNMLQDFMGGSHDSMVTLENRVRGLERVVEDMARDLSISSGRRGNSFMAGFEGSSNRPLGKYNGFPDYSPTKLGRGGDGRIPFGERFASSDGIAMGMRGRGSNWRSDMSEAWDYHTYGKNGQMSSRRALSSVPIDGRSPKSEHENDQVGSRRAWDKGSGPVRFGEGPSARSVWQASKDEATLEAIRVAGEDNGTARTARVAIPELTAEALGDDNNVQERDPTWTSWTNAMDALHVGDMDSAYAEVLSTGDDLLLVKLMDRSGPVVDQLSNEVASEVLYAVAQFLLEQNLFEICLSWIQQLVDVVENGPDMLSIPNEVQRELLLNLHEAASTIDPSEDWEGATPEQLLLQLASAWQIDLQRLGK